MNYTELSKRIHAANVAKGFWPEEGRDMGEVFALIHAEASEALEAHRKGLPMDAPVGVQRALDADRERGGIVPSLIYRDEVKDLCVAEELADVVIRVLDLAGYLGHKVSLSKISDGNFDNGISFGRMICTLHLFIANASERENYFYLRSVIAVVESICKVHGIDLAAHIEAKLAYNSTRPAKHGKLY